MTLPRSLGAGLVAAALVATASPALADKADPTAPRTPATMLRLEAGDITDGVPDTGSEPSVGGGVVGDAGGLGAMPKKVTANIDVALQLKKASIEKFDPNDGDDEFVQFVFGNKVLDIYDPAAFKLIGVSSTEVVSAVDVFRNEKNANALLVAFPPGVDPTDYPLAAVAPGAVGSIKGEVNPGDSIPLVGSKTKDSLSTAVPKLVQVKIEPSLERIVYQFDQKLDESGADPANFGFYSFEGILHKAAAITSGALPRPGT